MARLHWLPALAGAFLTAGAIILPGTALAQDNTCDTHIVDATPNHLEANQAVVDAANQLASTGADVRLRVMQTTPSGVDSYEADMERSCASWEGPDGLRKANLVSVLVDLGAHRTAIFYGSDWHVLDGHSENIQASAMNPQFKKGQYAQGLTSGLQQVTQLLKGGSAGDSTSSTSTAFGSLVKGILSAIALFVILSLLYVGLGRAWRRYQSNQTARRLQESQRTQARAAARTAKARAADLMLEVSSINRESVKTPADYLVRFLSGEAATAVQTRCDQALHILDEAVSEYGTYASISGTDHDPDADHTTAEYQGITAAFTSLASQLAAAQEQITSLDVYCTETLKQVEQFPAKLEALRQSLVTLETHITETEQGGLRATEATDHLHTARKQVDEASALFERRDLTAAHAQLEQATAAHDRGNEVLQELPRLRDRLLTEHTTQSQAVSHNGTQLAAARTILEQLRQSYVQTSWNDLTTILQQAEQDLQRQVALVDEISRQLEAQAWPKVADLLLICAGLTKMVSKDCHSIKQRQIEIEAAVTAVPKLLAQAHNSLEQKRKTIRERRGDQTGPSNKLDGAGKKLEAIELVMKGRIDYLSVQSRLNGVLSTINSANSASLEIHNDAESAERRRRAATSRSRTSPSRPGSSGRRSGGYSSTTYIGGGGSWGDSGGGGSSSWGDSGGGSSSSWGGDGGGGGSTGW